MLLIFYCLYIKVYFKSFILIQKKKTKLLFYGCIPLVFELAVDFELALVSPWRRCLS